MAYVIFGDPVFKAPVEKFQDTFNAQGPYYEYCNEQAKLIEAQNNFERLNRLVMKARPSYGFPYPHIPTAPFPIYNKAVVESRPEIFTYYGNTVFVNAKAHAVLESVEPNVHQYIPVQFVNPKGGPELEPYCVSGPTDTKMILKVNKDVLAGRAIWAEWKLSFCFLTDAFVEALREAGIEPGYAHNDFHAEEI